MFITFEGIEGSGKTRALNQICAALSEESVSFVSTHEPGGSSVGRALRPLLLHKTHPLSPEAELFMFLADRAQHVSKIIRPALESGDVVLCDRYADSTLAYQGYGRGMSMDTLLRLNQLATGGLWPDLTLILDLEVEEGLRRAFTRNADRDGMSSEDARFETEPLEFHRRVRDGYLKLAEQDPQRCRVVNAALAPEVVDEQITDILADRFSLNLA
ncbi:MAG: dTMP kinase [Desulfovibrio sp.]|jgi:dTMP kinase|nr:dTMP kinase [Desulfovibrio sp.]